MALIKKLNGITPKIANDVFLAENCVIIGDVIIEEGTSIWYNVVIRGDVNFIRIGKDCNIQDGTVIHATYQKYPTIIKDRVSIGHNAIIHACTIENDVLVGMGAIVMDNVVVNPFTFIAAGSVVTPNQVLEPYSLYAGVPAKKIKDIDEKLINTIKTTVEHYKLYTNWYLNVHD